VSEKVDELASDVDDALVSADALADDRGDIKGKNIDKVKNALETAKKAPARSSILAGQSPATALCAQRSSGPAASM
jgi:hypothetical protein